MIWKNIYRHSVYKFSTWMNSQLTDCSIKLPIRVSNSIERHAEISIHSLSSFTSYSSGRLAWCSLGPLMDRFLLNPIYKNKLLYTYISPEYETYETYDCIWDNHTSICIFDKVSKFLSIMWSELWAFKFKVEFNTARSNDPILPNKLLTPLAAR